MDRPLRTFLIGAKTLAVEMLDALTNHKSFEVVGVLTKDHWDDMKVWHEIGEANLTERATEYDLNVYGYQSVNNRRLERDMISLNLDYLFCASWPELLNRRILEIPRIGCFNIHASLLPKNRGGFPIHWAIINGEQMGITIHKMSSGPDNGHIVAQAGTDIAKDFNSKNAWKRVMSLGCRLFRKILPKFADLSFISIPQDESLATHHSRHLPYGGQVNPYWHEDKKKRFLRAMDFPPFENLKSDVPAIMEGYETPSVRIAIGFDCDAPRGSHIASPEGKDMAEEVAFTILRINRKLNEFDAPRTCFICGDFLESMNNYMKVNDLFVSKRNRDLLEIADHTFYHSAIKSIPTRPDRPPIKSFVVMKEWEKNTKLFKEILGLDISKRGFRAPYGYYEGLKGQDNLLDKLKEYGCLYTSSDLRDELHNVFGHLFNKVDMSPHQPYRYPNGLLEIPSHGWQDTAFTSGKTPVQNFILPKGIDEILKYYSNLIKVAFEKSQVFKRDYFLALTLHPHAIMLYDPELKTFDLMKKELDRIGGHFVRHIDIFNHYGGF